MQLSPFEKFHHVFRLQSTKYLKLLDITYMCLFIFAESNVFNNGRTLKLENKILQYTIDKVNNKTESNIDIQRQFLPVDDYQYRRTNVKSDLTDYRR